MITKDLATLRIHKLSQEQYLRELEAGNIDPNAIYLTPENNNALEEHNNSETAHSDLRNKFASLFMEGHDPITFDYNGDWSSIENLGGFDAGSIYLFASPIPVAINAKIDTIEIINTETKEIIEIVSGKDCVPVEVLPDIYAWTNNDQILFYSIFAETPNGRPCGTYIHAFAMADTAKHVGKINFNSKFIKDSYLPIFEETENIIFDEVVNDTENMISLLNLKVGNNYKIFVDDQEYEFTCKTGTMEGMPLKYIGNYQNMTPPIVGEIEGMYGAIIVNEAPCNIKIIEINKKIKPNYLHISDWNVTDENNPSIILNKPFNNIPEKVLIECHNDNITTGDLRIGSLSFTPGFTYKIIIKGIKSSDGSQYDDIETTGVCTVATYQEAPFQFITTPSVDITRSPDGVAWASGSGLPAQGEYEFLQIIQEEYIQQLDNKFLSILSHSYNAIIDTTIEINDQVVELPQTVNFDTNISYPIVVDNIRYEVIPAQALIDEIGQITFVGNGAILDPEGLPNNGLPFIIITADGEDGHLVTAALIIDPETTEIASGQHTIQILENKFNLKSEFLPSPDFNAVEGESGYIKNKAYDRTKIWKNIYTGTNHTEFLIRMKLPKETFNNFYPGSFVKATINNESYIAPILCDFASSKTLDSTLQMALPGIAGGNGILVKDMVGDMYTMLHTADTPFFIFVQNADLVVAIDNTKIENSYSLSIDLETYDYNVNYPLITTVHFPYDLAITSIDDYVEYYRQLVKVYYCLIAGQKVTGTFNNNTVEIIEVYLKTQASEPSSYAITAQSMSGLINYNITGGLQDSQITVTTLDDSQNQIPTTIPTIQTAQAGQVIIVKEIDENGKPIAWEASHDVIVNNIILNGADNNQYKLFVNENGELSIQNIE